MPATVSIDGATKLIVISDTGDVTISAKDIYSRWKDWVIDNPQWVNAFRTFGNDPLGGGIYAGDYYFLNNTDGWRIKPEEKDHILTITGNLFAEDAGIDIFQQTVGAYNVQIVQKVSSLTQTAGGSNAADIADAVWDELKAGHTTANTTGKILQDLETIARQIKALSAANL
jgi:hypothetical protein